MSDLQALNRKSADVTLTYPERIVQFGAGNFLRAFSDQIIMILRYATLCTVDNLACYNQAVFA